MKIHFRVLAAVILGTIILTLSIFLFVDIANNQMQEKIKQRAIGIATQELEYRIEKFQEKRKRSKKQE